MATEGLVVGPAAVAPQTGAQPSQVNVDGGQPLYREAPRPQRGVRPSEALDRISSSDYQDSLEQQPLFPERDNPRQAPTREERVEQALQDQQNAEPEERAPDEEQYDLEAPPKELEYDEEGNPLDPQEFQRQQEIAFNAMKQAFMDGKFPLDQLADFPVSVKVNGEERQVPLAEALEGYSRTEHHTRRLQEANQINDRANHILQLERARNQEWQDPDQLIYGLQSMGLGKAFNQAVYKRASEIVNYRQMPPEKRQLFDEQQRLQHERMQFEQQRRMAEQQARQQQGPDPYTAHVTKQIEQLMPRALKGQGVGVYAYSQEIFLKNLQILCEDGQISPQRAREAAIATRELLEDQARMRGETVAPRPQQSAQPGQQPRLPLGPRRLGSGSGTQAYQRPQGQLGGSPQPQRPGQSVSSSGQKGFRPSDIINRLGVG